jgi:hypothetical protein
VSDATLPLFPTNPVKYIVIHPPDVCVQLRVTRPTGNPPQTWLWGAVYALDMSIPVTIDDLASATGEYGWAYLLTVRDDLRPHIVAVSPTWVGDQLVMAVGRGTARNAAARPSISLCYPPVEEGGYSLIVDGDASIEGAETVRFTPTGAVLHRPAPDGFTGSPTGCGNDCEPVGPSGG